MSTLALQDYVPRKHRNVPLVPPLEPVQEPPRNLLNEIASLTRSLTYAEMMQFAGALWQPIITTPPATQEELAKLIHGWSVGR